jgi:hypothetical protein
LATPCLQAGPARKTINRNAADATSASSQNVKALKFVRDVEDFVRVRREMRFYKRELYSLPEYKKLHEEERKEARKQVLVYR